MNETYNLYLGMVNGALQNAVPFGETIPTGREDIPRLLGEAMRYSLMAGGKRLRPVILLAAHALKVEDVTPALPYAVALEMIHTYSLIHDDLPAMDDDDLRRGKPTCHKVYGEAMAILAGDGLFHMAFETMLNQAVKLGTPGAVAAAKDIARRAGVTGMIAGQALDVSMEGHAPDIDLVSCIHLRKTADMFTGAMEAGLHLAGANEEEIKAGAAFGEHLGLAFQIVDDLLDLVGEEAILGKRVGADEKHQKLTWPSCVGIEKARRDAREHIGLAIEALSVFEQRGNFLACLAQSMLDRVQ
jgi:geranylgeranyl diphosphate synthase type II